MRRFLKLALCAICFLLYFLASLVLSAVLAFSKPTRKRYFISRLIRLFAFCLVRIINIRIRLVPAPSPDRSGNDRGLPERPGRKGSGAFLVSNHLGYTDGLILGALFSVVYVSKSELKKWPLIGLMTEVSGTLFVDRSRKNHIAQYIDDISSTLKAGVNILFFPEGTSTNGEELLAFKTAFFEAPLRVGAPIIPISIVYKNVDGVPVDKSNRDRIYWYGDMTFVDHFSRLLSCRRVEAQVTIHPAIVPLGADAGEALRRKEASEAAYAAILRDIKLMR